MVETRPRTDNAHMQDKLRSHQTPLHYDKRQGCGMNCVVRKRGIVRTAASTD